MAADKTVFESYLHRLGEDDWAESLVRILPRIHPADSRATRIWFAFWPLKLRLALDGTPDPAQVFKDLQLDGKPRLEEQIDASVAFLFGSHYWPEVKQAVAAYAEEALEPQETSLDSHILELAGRLAARLQVEQSLLAGIVSVGVMVLRQVGRSSLATCAGEPSPNGRPKSAAGVMKLRRGRGWKSLIWKSRKYRVTFDESVSESCYEALDGQDLSMASGSDPRDFRESDPRRVAGPVPVQCRSGACGYCWIGVLAGEENLSEMTAFEKRRLEYFGYAPPAEIARKHPAVRLACQSKCYGDVSIVVPPWNGVLQEPDPEVSADAGD
ncbi:MAG: (2Fe-2S)-binding protein [Acidobacteria bacterium]|nr:(2Fe-2S)-binding protein [Acidobacteriota bacterium]MYC83417.1 (2Fe-2S)-binding protein [Acidobacteriota bacterium]